MSNYERFKDIAPGYLKKIYVKINSLIIGLGNKADVHSAEDIAKDKEFVRKFSKLLIGAAHAAEKDAPEQKLKALKDISVALSKIMEGVDTKSADASLEIFQQWNDSLIDFSKML